MPTKEDLKALQSESLERKVRITQTRIIEWYKHYNGQVYVSFSGGKDSTVLLHLARLCFPDIEAVFIDTGLEYPEIRDFVKTFDNVTWLKPEMRFDEVISKYGYPIISKNVSQIIYEYRKNPKCAIVKHFDNESDYIKKYGQRFSLAKYIPLRDSDIPISHLCCHVMKKKPAKKFEKASGKMPILGTMADESQLRKASWMKNGCNAFNSKRPISQPMSFWTEQDVLHYLELTGLPYASVYGEIIPIAEFEGQMALNTMVKLKTTKCQRTGCVFCGFGAHLEKEPNRFQMLKETHPKMYDYCIREENGLGMGKVLDYIGVKY